ncbi:MAG: Homoaconitate hydratase/3-isopropylmalate dehydratase large subunit LeuC family protein [Candidatus Methanohalarchaeum thermophilum]|uniref:3-isopropylmalate dehydratase large subunit n=1 Tax=Methanohalarchaeum thermophilum TaxID=1903181 RepID=A0A1Q6DW74_METT1|nr:MAG: Homoaconitate hydratase/3-isopropylmalate dehydratase large subunit LeuC family protein [Candidatus Methanohalarchaeum thermophilum]
MEKTIVEKIFSNKTGSEVKSGDIVSVEVDFAMAQDGTAPLAIRAFEEMDMDVENPEKLALVIDHISPSKSEGASELHQKMRSFASEYGIKLYDVGEGICHQLMLENHVDPGKVIIGADSHTCTYGALGAFATGVGSTDMGAAFATGELWFKVPESIKINVNGELPENVSAKDVILKLCGEIGADGAIYKALEFRGSTIRDMSIASRATLCNMAIEVGAKTGIVEPDQKVEEYTGTSTNLSSDEEADYIENINLDVSELSPQIAVPHQVDNVSDIGEVEGKEIDQVVLGSCTNGRFEDLKRAADVLEGNEVSDQTRFLVFPASKSVYEKAIEEGVIQTFINAGATVCNPGCGPCPGTHMGILAPGERAISTTNRNFQGRMGSTEAEVYLSSPETAAYSGIKGKISDPRRE